MSAIMKRPSLPRFIFELWPDVPVLAAALLLYPLLAAAGGGTIAIVYAQKEVRA